MRLRLDTHVLLWSLATPERLSDDTRETIQDPRTTVFVSTASVWEMAIKSALGTLATPDDLDQQLRANRFDVLPISPDHAQANEREIERIVVEAGASGYTVFDGSGKGSHHVKRRDRPSVVDDFSLVKIEVIVADRTTADAIVAKVASAYFDEFSGIVYLEEVEILRLEKF